MSVDTVTEEFKGQEKSHSRRPRSDEEPVDHWALFERLGSKFDDDLVDGFEKTLDVLLIFATLFSAIIGTFITLSIQRLSPEPLDQTNQLIRMLLAANQNQAVAPAAPFVPSAEAIRINAFLFSSLACSLLASFGAVLCKQWLQYYKRSGLGGTLEQQGRERQRRFNGVQKWSFQGIIHTMPTLLQLSLFLFFLGLAEYLWSINVVIAGIFISFAGVGAIFYLYTTIAAIWDRYCPFQTPVSRLLHRASRWSGFPLLIPLQRVPSIRRPLRKAPSLPIRTRSVDSYRGDRKRPSTTRTPHSPNYIVDAQTICWTLSNTFNEDALLGAARHLLELKQMESAQYVLRDPAFVRLVDFFIHALSVCCTKTAAHQPHDVSQDAAVIFGRALCHVLVGASDYLEIRSSSSKHSSLLYMGHHLHLLPAELRVQAHCLLASDIGDFADVASEAVAGAERSAMRSYVALYATEMRKTYTDEIIRHQLQPLTSLLLSGDPDRSDVAFAAWCLRACSTNERLWTVIEWDSVCRDGYIGDRLTKEYRSLLASAKRATAGPSISQTADQSQWWDAFTCVNLSILPFVQDFPLSESFSILHDLTHLLARFAHPTQSDAELHSRLSSTLSSAIEEWIRILKRTLTPRAPDTMSANIGPESLLPGAIWPLKTLSTAVSELSDDNHGSALLRRVHNAYLQTFPELILHEMHHTDFLYWLHVIWSAGVRCAHGTESQLEPVLRHLLAVHERKPSLFIRSFCASSQAPTVCTQAILDEDSNICNLGLHMTRHILQSPGSPLIDSTGKDHAMTLYDAFDKNHLLANFTECLSRYILVLRNEDTTRSWSDTDQLLFELIRIVVERHSHRMVNQLDTLLNVASVFTRSLLERTNIVHKSEIVKNVLLIWNSCRAKFVGDRWFAEDIMSALCCCSQDPSTKLSEDTRALLAEYLEAAKTYYSLSDTESRRDSNVPVTATFALVDETLSLCRM